MCKVEATSLAAFRLNTKDISRGVKILWVSKDISDGKIYNWDSIGLLENVVDQHRCYIWADDMVIKQL